MDTKKTIQRGLLVLLALLLLGGCGTFINTAQLKTPGTIGNMVTLEDLVKNWDAYNVYYAGLADDTPAALLFDPKNDQKALSGKRWEKVEDRKLLTSMVDFIKRYSNFDPRLYSIVGPDHQVYGYVFSPTNEVYMRVADERTIYVYDVESPLYRNDGNDQGGTIPTP